MLERLRDGASVTGQVKSRPAAGAGMRSFAAEHPLCAGTRSSWPDSSVLSDSESELPDADFPGPNIYPIIKRDWYLFNVVT